MKLITPIFEENTIENYGLKRGIKIVDTVCQPHSKFVGNVYKTDSGTQSCIQECKTMRANTEPCYVANVMHYCVHLGFGLGLELISVLQGRF